MSGLVSSFSGDFNHQLLAGYQTIESVSRRPSLVGALGFDEMKNNAMLQAADLIAWHYRRATEIHKGFRTEPYHRAFTQLIRRDDVFQFIAKDKFVSRTMQMFKEHGARWDKEARRIMAERLQEQQMRRATRRKDRSKRN